eukprot:131164-Chlamydomonas_euryale.AAC.1
MWGIDSSSSKARCVTPLVPFLHLPEGGVYIACRSASTGRVGQTRGIPEVTPNRNDYKVYKGRKKGKGPQCYCPRWPAVLD